MYNILQMSFTLVLSMNRFDFIHTCTICHTCMTNTFADRGDTCDKCAIYIFDQTPISVDFQLFWFLFVSTILEGVYVLYQVYLYNSIFSVKIWAHETRLHKYCLLLTFSLLNNGMTKRTAGLVIFRRVNSQLEFLMLKPSKDGKVWTPPKGLENI